MDTKSRPTVNIYKINGKKKSTTALPDVFLAPIRPDVVRRIYSLAHKNTRQPQGRKMGAGMGYAAESWGTGRAVSRIPRVPGGGTHKAGSGAFGNMCVGGRVFSPLRTWRQWHHKIQDNERRYAISSAIAASSNAALVMAHGHRISTLAEIPLVVSNKLEGLSKTRDVERAMKNLGLTAEINKIKRSKRLRSGKGKRSGAKRRVHKKGPLIVYKENKGIKNGIKNLLGFSSVQVDKLNILGLAPGAQLGRLIIWTEDAFNYLNTFFGTYGDKPDSLIHKKGTQIPYQLPRPIMSNTDIERIIKSDAIQDVIKTPNYEKQKPKPKHHNYLQNYKQKIRINPHAAKILRLQYRQNLKQKKVVKGIEKPTKQQKRLEKLREKMKEGMEKNYLPKILGPALVAEEEKPKEEQQQ